VSDPAFEAADHRATDAYLRGEAKEGAGMGGALAQLSDSDVSLATLHDRIGTVTDRLLAEREATPP
jgi:NaMN:DMB phosphoribosyltransferase